jgi:uncharacterized membrane protein HdeD (DUF308 family)
VAAIVYDESHPVLAVIANAWRSLIVRGVLLVVLGVAALVFAREVVWVATALALYALIHGLLDIIGTLRSKESSAHSGLVMAQGVLWIAGGAATFYWLTTAFTFGYVIAFWSVGLGVVAILLAAAGGTHFPHRWLSALLGILALIFGGWLLHDPGKLLAIGPAVEIAVLAFVSGATMLTFGLQARHLRKRRLPRPVDATIVRR